MDENEQYAREVAGRVFDTKDWVRKSGWIVVAFSAADPERLLVAQVPGANRSGFRKEGIYSAKDWVMLVDVDDGYFWNSHVEDVKRSAIWTGETYGAKDVPVVTPEKTPDTGVHPGVRLVRRTTTEEIG